MEGALGWPIGSPDAPFQPSRMSFGIFSVTWPECVGEEFHQHSLHEFYMFGRACGDHSRAFFAWI